MTRPEWEAQLRRARAWRDECEDMLRKANEEIRTLIENTPKQEAA